MIDAGFVPSIPINPMGHAPVKIPPLHRQRDDEPAEEQEDDRVGERGCRFGNVPEPERRKQHERQQRRRRNRDRLRDPEHRHQRGGSGR